MRSYRRQTNETEILKNIGLYHYNISGGAVSAFRADEWTNCLETLQEQ